MDFFVGSNGNLFFDTDQYRYCISWEPGIGYDVLRNGSGIHCAASAEEAQEFVRREVVREEWK